MKLNLSEAVDCDTIYKYKELDTAKEDMIECYKTSVRVLDLYNIDYICNKLYYKEKNKVQEIFICKMNNNSYALVKKLDYGSIEFISKNHRKREMIKRGYIKRDSELKREDREINNRFRKSKYNR